MRVECSAGKNSFFHWVFSFLSTGSLRKDNRVVSSSPMNAEIKDINKRFLLQKKVQFISETITCLASGSSMLYWVPAGPSLTLSPRRKPRRVINVLAASSTDGGGPSSRLDSPAEAERRAGGRRWMGGEENIAGERKKEQMCVSGG